MFLPGAPHPSLSPSTRIESWRTGSSCAVAKGERSANGPYRRAGEMAVWQPVSMIGNEKMICTLQIDEADLSTVGSSKRDCQL